MKTKIFLVVFLIVSTLANMFLYSKTTEAKIASYEKPVFTFLDSYFDIKVSGYIKWNDSKKQPSDIRQFYLININGFDSKIKCEILDIWDWKGSHVFISKPEECSLQSLDKSKKIAMVFYRDLVFIINENEATFKSQNKDEAGGGILVTGYKL